MESLDVLLLVIDEIIDDGFIDFIKNNLGD